MARITAALSNLLALLARKPVSLLVGADAVLGICAAFDVLGVGGWSGTQWAAVQGLFTALGAKATTMVTANVQLAAEAEVPPPAPAP